MIKLHRHLLFTFTRSRIRQEMRFDPKLKDFTATEEVTVQTNEMRKEFESTPTETFTNTLNEPNPKLGHKFEVDKTDLHKKIRTLYKEKISIENLEANDEHDFKYLASSKSHLNDQTEEIEFEEKFRQQLFRSKETKRLINKKSKSIKNYIPTHTKDIDYLEYEEAKTKLKNKKINNMMNMNRNNEQLQLLIESGLFNNPTNIQNLISQLEAHQVEAITHQTEPSVEPISNTAITIKSEEKHIAHQMDDIGPEQLKERNNIKEFISKYEEQHRSDRESCLEDLKLLNQIREFEQSTFMNRYDDINFRFKGQVTFGFFKENELVSYLKNETIEPKDLLLMFEQNRNKLSKFELPIITPPVMAAIYSKTSLYKFPETDTNNHLNMLNDKNFQNLERSLFKESAKLNDTDFCSVLWAYAQNHQDEQGILRKNLSDKINDVIFEELSFRIYNLSEEDLGLAMRGMCKLNLAKQGNKWVEIVDFLNRKLPIVTNFYTLESIFDFLMCLPFSKEVLNTVESNFELYGEHEWKDISTLLSFAHVSGLILKESRNEEKAIVMKAKISYILVKAENELHSIIPQLSINALPQFLTILRESEASVILTKTVNLCKKITIDNIKGQVETIKERNLANLVGNFCLLDFQKYLLSQEQKYSQNKKLDDIGSLLKKLTLKTITVLQPIPYNSSNFYLYHEIATFMYAEMYNLKNSVCAKMLEHLALIRYKNERLVDDVGKKIIQSIEGFETSLERKQEEYEPVVATVRALVNLCNSYALQRRDHDVRIDALDMLFGKYFQSLIKESPNSLVRFVSSSISLENEKAVNEFHQEKLEKIVKILIAHSKGKSFIGEELASLVYSCVMLNNYSWALELLYSVNFDEIYDPSIKFILTFSKLISSLSVGKTDLEMLKSNFESAEKLFFSSMNPEILYNESCIGSPFSSQQLKEKLIKILQEKENCEILSNAWFLSVPERKRVYFLATYDHLKVNIVGTKPEVELFGIWKMYEKYYKIIGWEIKTVITFLEGK